MRALLKMSYTHGLEKDHFDKISPKYRFQRIKQIPDTQSLGLVPCHLQGNWRNVPSSFCVFLDCPLSLRHTLLKDIFPHIFSALAQIYHL